MSWWAERRSLILFCLAGFLSSSAFLLWWQPYVHEFWGIPVMLWVLFVAGIMPSNWAQGGPKKVAMVLVPLGVFLSNGVLSIWPRLDPTTNTNLQKTHFYLSHTSPRDLVVNWHWDWTETYLPYWSQSTRRYVSVLKLLYARDRNKQAMFQALDRHIAEAQQNGGRVFVVKIFDLPGEELEKFGLTRNDFSRYRRHLAWKVCGEPIWEVDSGA
jgi:hypothetical protein